MILCGWIFILCFFFFKQKTAYEMRISDWSSDVCSSDLKARAAGAQGVAQGNGAPIRVDAGIIVGDAEQTQYGKALRGKCLVKLNDVDLIEGQPRQGQRLLRSGNRPDAHDSRLHARG